MTDGKCKQFFAKMKLLISALILLLGGIFLTNQESQAESRAEFCASWGATQYFDELSTCVTSKLSPQGKNRYGPEQLLGEAGAWCEGVSGNGLGQEIRFYFIGAGSPKRFHIQNGYIKSRKAFRRNGRIALLRMRDDAGNVEDVRLQDTRSEQYFDVPWDRENISWIQFEIRAVYRGSKYKDTCISSFGPDFEGF